MVLRYLRRKRYKKRPFPGEWDPIVADRLPFATRFSVEEYERFRTHLKLFVWEKHWIGANELEVTDEMRVTIAGAAARLSRNLDFSVYDRLTEIVIYPSHYKHPQREHIIYGEAHTWGTVVLSWDAVTRGLGNPDDGHDTAIHEFAHVLDIRDGAFDGTPPIEDDATLRAWVRTFSQHYLAMRKGKKRVLRSYGSTNEAEFFAVATETFFEKPIQLKKKAPELYAELARFYRADPAASRIKFQARRARD